jgi:putative oxidoreductase
MELLENNTLTQIFGLLLSFGLVQIIGWVLSVITGLFLGKGAIDKIIGTQEMVGNFAFMKLEKYRLLTGLGELLGVVLLLIPATSLFGAILIVSFMSAATVIHLSLMGGNKTYVPILVGIFALVGHFLRVM